MDSQGHRDGFNMEPWTLCEQIGLSDIETEAEKYAESKTELASQTDMWYPVNGFCHI